MNDTLTLDASAIFSTSHIVSSRAFAYTPATEFVPHPVRAARAVPAPKRKTEHIRLAELSAVAWDRGGINE